MDIKGMKKFENYLKREEERAEWMRTANAEDIEYVKCQEDLQESILEKFVKIERVIGTSVRCLLRFVLREKFKSCLLLLLLLLLPSLSGKSSLVLCEKFPLLVACY